MQMLCVLLEVKAISELERNKSIVLGCRSLTDKVISCFELVVLENMMVHWCIQTV